MKMFIRSVNKNHNKYLNFFVPNATAFYNAYPKPLSIHCPILIVQNKSLQVIETISTYSIHPHNHKIDQIDMLLNKVHGSFEYIFYEWAKYHSNLKAC